MEKVCADATGVLKEMQERWESKRMEVVEPPHFFFNAEEEHRRIKVKRTFDQLEAFVGQVEDYLVQLRRELSVEQEKRQKVARVIKELETLAETKKTEPPKAPLVAPTPAVGKK